ncbi:hypothetical protein F4780DRAFT_768662 [Xylariomycetidae sp. FL0641]|nr:hypothetical protein F4780DRAFT_768662 [Xylariomycetidae sp. FL0641]
MSAALAMAPSPAPHDRPAYAELAPATAAGPAAGASSPSVPRTVAHSATPNAANTTNATPMQQRSDSSSPPRSAAHQPKSSPPSALRNVSTSSAPKIIVKKEPGSPDLPTTRHRPRKLDLSKNTTIGSGAATARPALGTRDGLGIQEVGLACLSPGFVTQDPVMKEHLQQSLNVREQQRRIIEARLQQQSAKGDGPDTGKDKDPVSQFAAKTPGISSRRNRAPPGLSIVAPSHERFANERVIQSAPLGQTFTGRHDPQPLTRHLANQPSNLSSTSHIHHVPANQTNNRLPPIADVFATQGLPQHTEQPNRSLYPASSHGPMPSPGLHPATTAPPVSARTREYKSAEEAQQELAGGRPELLPKLVHYTGHQPPTPPSPRNGPPHYEGRRSASKRRSRAEYEEGGSPPLGYGPSATRRGGPFGAGRDSPETQRQKREEFLRLCERAWDLFHS